MPLVSLDFLPFQVWLDCTRQMAPDFIAKDPKSSPVWEITGAEFTKAEIHTAAGISIRFPRVTKIRGDKDWKTATSLSELKSLFEASKESTNFDVDYDRNDDDSKSDSDVEMKAEEKKASKTKEKSSEKEKNRSSSESKDKEIQKRKESENSSKEKNGNGANHSSAHSRYFYFLSKMLFRLGSPGTWHNLI